MHFSKKVTFLDLFNLDEIQILQDAFAQAVGVASIITEIDGTPITKPSNFCRLCKDIIRKTAKGCENCYKSDAIIGKNNLTGPNIQICHSGGLWDAGASIFYDNQHIANWLIGQVRDETQDENKMLQYAKEIGADENEFIKAFKEVTSMSSEQFQNIAQMLFLLAKMLSKQAFQLIKQKKIIDELHQIEEKHQKMAMVASKTHSAVIITDSHGKIEWVNEGFSKITQYNKDEVMGLRPAQLLNGKNTSKEIVNMMRTKLSSGEGVSAELINYTKYGEEIILDIEIRPIKNDQNIVTNYIAIEQDITHRKKAEIEKEKMQKEIHMSSKLASIGKLAAGVAHEINNPLTIISGYNDLITKTLFENKLINETTQKVLNAQHDAVKRISTIVNGLRIYARMDSEKLENINLHDVILSSVDLIGNVYKKNDHTIIETKLAREKSIIRANSGKLQQVLMNLFSNTNDAMKFKNGGLITVETQQVRGNVILSVSDEGHGIKKDDIPKIFDAFYTSKAVGKGTGLGLSIVSSIISEFGGTIEVQSNEGKGAKFILSFPLLDTPEDPKREQEHQIDFQKLKGKILIVDDEEDIRFILRNILEDFGLEVSEAENGKHAIEKIKQEIFEIVITDINMPVMNGNELISEMKKYNMMKKIKVLVITGGIENGLLEPNPDKSDQSIGVITKPFASKALYEIMKTLLSR